MLEQVVEEQTVEVAGFLALEVRERAVQEEQERQRQVGHRLPT